MNRDFFKYIYDNPIIAALNDLSKIDDIIVSPCKIVFILTGDIMNIKKLVNKLRDNGKLVYIHVDLIEGFSQHTSAMEFINKEIKPDGIISTRSRIIRAANAQNIFTIQRLFTLDALSLVSGKESIKKLKPDAVELLPGLMPKIIREVHKETRVPIIAGGLIREKEDVIEALNAGAIGISTSAENVWYM